MESRESVILQMARIGEIYRHDIVVEVKPSFDARELPCAAALDNGMLAASMDLCLGGGAVLLFSLEPVGGPECVIRVERVDKDLVPGLYIRPAWCAYGSLDEGVMAALQVAGHNDSIAGALACKVDTLTSSRPISGPRDLVRPHGKCRRWSQKHKAEKDRQRYGTDH